MAHGKKVLTRRYVKQITEISRQPQFPHNYFKQPYPSFYIKIHFCIRGKQFYVSAVLFVYIREKKKVTGTKRLVFAGTRTVMASQLILYLPGYHSNVYTVTHFYI
jgi:hypothetical protein